MLRDCDARRTERMYVRVIVRDVRANWRVALSAIAAITAACDGEARISLLAPDELAADALAPDEPGADELALDAGVRVEAGVSVEAAVNVEAGVRVEAGVSVGAGVEIEAARAPLALRYDFVGTGTRVADLVGEADGELYGAATLDGSGGVLLDGVDDYVDMPNHMLSAHSSVTIMAWLEWHGGPCWQRVFDFGNNDAGEDQVGIATTSLFLTPTSCPDQVMLSMTERGEGREAVVAQRALPFDRNTQVALVIDGELGEATLYVDGEREGARATAHAMSDLDDVNNWLGRSQWVQDGYLKARYDELRIYSGALTQTEISELFARGADAP